MIFSKKWNALRLVVVVVVSAGSSSGTAGLGATCGGVCVDSVLLGCCCNGVGVCVASVRVATRSVLVPAVCKSVVSVVVPADTSGIVGVCVRCENVIGRSGKLVLCSIRMVAWVVRRVSVTMVDSVVGPRRFDSVENSWRVVA